MLRPKREKPTNSFLSKFVRVFGLLMTLLYVALGLFIMFADSAQMNMTLPQNVKYILGGIMILYGIVRFVRVYKSTSRTKNDRYED